MPKFITHVIGLLLTVAPVWAASYYAARTSLYGVRTRR